MLGFRCDVFLNAQNDRFGNDSRTIWLLKQQSGVGQERPMIIYAGDVMKYGHHISMVIQKMTVAWMVRYVQRTAIGVYIPSNEPISQ